MRDDRAVWEARRHRPVKDVGDVERRLVGQKPDAAVEPRIQRPLERGDDLWVGVTEIVDAAAARAVDQLAWPVKS